MRKYQKISEELKAISLQPLDRPAPEQFGRCPKCGKTDGYINDWKDQWMVCNEHKYKWPLGHGTFSSYLHMTEEELKQEHEKLKDFVEVKPWHEPDFSGSIPPYWLEGEDGIKPEKPWRCCARHWE